MGYIGARSRNRTGTTLRSRDFKSLVSTNFTTRAYDKLLFLLHFNIYCYLTTDTKNAQNCPKNYFLRQAAVNTICLFLNCFTLHSKVQHDSRFQANGQPYLLFIAHLLTLNLSHPFINMGAELFS